MDVELDRIKRIGRGTTRGFEAESAPDIDKCFWPSFPLQVHSPSTSLDDIVGNRRQPELIHWRPESTNGPSSTMPPSLNRQVALARLRSNLPALVLYHIALRADLYRWIRGGCVAVVLETGKVFLNTSAAGWNRSRADDVWGWVFGEQPRMRDIGVS